MKPLPLLLTALALASPAPARGDANPGEQEIPDPQARRIHRRMMEAMGGAGAWERARYLEFDWILTRGGRQVRRSHRWDRWTGRYRVEAPLGEGRTMVALFQVDAPEEGRVWVEGEERRGAAADSLLRRAYGIFINDSYWLLMPYKWTDPGVRLRYLGRRTDPEGRTWEVVELTFEEGVGLTPQNVYHAYVDPESGLMERWYHFREAGARPLVADWREWEWVGPIRLALDRPFLSTEGRIRFENVRCEAEVPEGAFAPPAP